MPLGANKAAIMGVAGVSTADVVLLSSQTADGDDEIDFTDLFTSTYGEYIFKFYNINPATDSKGLTFQVNATTDDGGDYDDGGGDDDGDDDDGDDGDADDGDDDCGDDDDGCS